MLEAFILLYFSLEGCFFYRCLHYLLGRLLPYLFIVAIFDGRATPDFVALSGISQLLYLPL